MWDPATGRRSPSASPVPSAPHRGATARASPPSAHGVDQFRSPVIAATRSDLPYAKRGPTRSILTGSPGPG